MSHPYPTFGSQDLHDDDGPVLDLLLTDSHEPADIKGAIAPIEVQGPITPTNPSRLFAFSQYLSTAGNTTDIRQLLSADPNRKTCKVRANYVSTAGLTLIIADERTKLAGVANWASLADAGSTGLFIASPMVATAGVPDIDLDGHTGALWIAGVRTLTSQTAPFDMIVSAWGVSGGNH